MLVYVVTDRLDQLVSAFTEHVGAERAENMPYQQKHRQHNTDADQHRERVRREISRRVLNKHRIDKGLGQVRWDQHQRRRTDGKDHRSDQLGKLRLQIHRKPRNDLALVLTVDTFNTGRGKGTSTAGTYGELLLVGDSHDLPLRGKTLPRLDIFHEQNGRVTKRRNAKGIAKYVPRLILSLATDADKGIAVHSFGKDLGNFGVADPHRLIGTVKVKHRQRVRREHNGGFCIISLRIQLAHKREDHGGLFCSKGLDPFKPLGG